MFLLYLVYIFNKHGVIDRAHALNHLSAAVDCHITADDGERRLNKPNYRLTNTNLIC